jgi:hypothetical protein
MSNIETLGTSPLTKLYGALAAVQAEMGAVKKDSTNSHFHSEYTSLGAVIEATRGLLTKHGLVLVQTPFCRDSTAGVTTFLIHTSGEFLSFETSLPLERGSAHAAGSCFTYARRYAQKCLFNMVDADDDAEEAEGRGRSALQAPKPSAKIPAIKQPDKPPQDRDWLKEIAAAASLAHLETLREEIVARVPRDKRVAFSAPYNRRKQELSDEAVNSQEVQQVLSEFRGSRVAEVKAVKE